MNVYCYLISMKVDLIDIIEMPKINKSKTFITLRSKFNQLSAEYKNLNISNKSSEYRL